MIMYEYRCVERFEQGYSDRLLGSIEFLDFDIGQQHGHTWGFILNWQA